MMASLGPCGVSCQPGWRNFCHPADTPGRLHSVGGAASKLNRDPRFIQRLTAHGEQQAGEFLAALAFERTWAAKDVAAVMGRFAGDCELVSAPPFSAPGRHRGSGPVRRLVQDLLSAGVRVDLTRKVLARERVTWTLRTRGEDGGTGPSGQAEAEFRDGKVTSLRLG